MTTLSSHRKFDAVIDANHTSSRLKVFHHPIAMAIGGLVGGIATAATASLMVGVSGAIIGFVVGIVAGGLGGKALAELVWPYRGDLTVDEIHTDPSRLSGTH